MPGVCTRERAGDEGVHGDGEAVSTNGKVVSLAERTNDGRFTGVIDAFTALDEAIADLDKQGYKPRKCLLYMYFENDQEQYAVATSRGGCKTLLEALGLRALVMRMEEQMIDDGGEGT